MLLTNLLLNKFCSHIVFSVSSAESCPEYPTWSEHWSSHRPSTQASRPRNIKRTTPRQMCANSWTSEERATSLEIPQARKTAESAQMQAEANGKTWENKATKNQAQQNHEKEEDKTVISLVRDAQQDLAAASQQRSKRWGRNLRSCRRSWSLLVLEAFRKKVSTGDATDQGRDAILVAVVAFAASDASLAP